MFTLLNLSHPPRKLPILAVLRFYSLDFGRFSFRVGFGFFSLVSRSFRVELSRFASINFRGLSLWYPRFEGDYPFCQKNHSMQRSRLRRVVDGGDVDGFTPSCQMFRSRVIWLLRWSMWSSTSRRFVWFQTLDDTLRCNRMGICLSSSTRAMVHGMIPPLGRRKSVGLCSTATGPHFIDPAS